MNFKLLVVVQFLTSCLYAYSDLFMLDLEELSNIEIKNTSATLTKTDIKNIPASITVITHKDIVESGARNLDELLEIYVPSFAYMYKVQGSQIGFRGIISDRNNKVLLLVNNRVMNIKTTDGGADTERWFSTLGDIDNIKVITGSGSAIYGSGAIAGVISIETFSGKTRDGVHVSSKVGIGQEFYNTEVSYGTTIKDDIHLYLYYGISKNNGADNDDAPMKFAFNYKNVSNTVIPADTRYIYNNINDYGSLGGDLEHKVHFQLDSDDFLFWARFTKTSLATPTTQQMYYWESPKNIGKYQDTGTKNQQITLFAQKKQKVSSDLDITYQLSYLRSDMSINFFEDGDVNGGDKFFGEDNLMVKVLANYEINQKNQLAIGAEYNYNWFGRKSELSSYDYSKTGVLPDNTKWSSDLISFFGEYQTNFTKNLTMFIGVRVDTHKYSPTMYSPRIDFIYNNNNEDIVKLGFNRSSRHSDEAVMYEVYENEHTFDDVEEIDTVELSYTKYFNNYMFNLATYHNNHNLLSWNNTKKITENIGNVKSYGLEVEFSYKRDDLEFYISHSYTKMYNFSLKDSSIIMQNVSASAYGYGNDFANWNDHITKVRFNYHINKKLKWTNSLRIFWGMDGAQDMADYNKDLNLPLYEQYILPYYDDGHTTAFGESIYLNTAFIYNVTKQMVLSLNAYNILGLINEDYNKRNFFQTTSQYRDMAPSLSVGLEYKF